MTVVRRCSAGAVVAGLVLLGGPAWAQEEDPCAPGPDGSVPEMCQSGPVEEPAAGSGEPTDPEDPCAGSRPVEPGDGEVTEGEPAPEEPVEGEPEPAPDEPVSSDPEPKPEETLVSEEPPPGEEDGVVCAFGAPVSGPAESAPVEESVPVDAVAAELPRTGPQDRLLALAAVGSGILVLGAGAAAAGRRRRPQV